MIFKKSLPILTILLAARLDICGQKAVITGRLLDHQTLKPVSGIPVIWFGTTLGTKSLEDGNFSLEVKAQPSEILISGNSMDGDGAEYYYIAIRNIPLDRKQRKVDLGDIWMIRIPVNHMLPEPLEALGDKFPYTFKDGHERRIEGPYIVVDLGRPFKEEDLSRQQAQDSVDCFFSARYPGGSLELRKYFSHNLEYPLAAAQREIVGLSLATCTLEPDGSIQKVEILNPLCPSIDTVVLNILRATDGRWRSIDEDTLQTFYTQMLFTIEGIPFHYNTFSDLNVLKDVQVAAIVPNSGTSDDDIARSINESLTAGDYQAALQGLDEGIRRNPFLFELYQVRIMVNTKLGDNERVMEDVARIGNFINGKSLQQVLSGE